MQPVIPKLNHTYRDGFNAGYLQGVGDSATNAPKTQQQFYVLTAHDLDTLAMGIALVVLHASDIETIAATMDTQQKLRVAEKVLGWLHLIAHTGGLGADNTTLHETRPHPWLDRSVREDRLDREKDPRDYEADNVRLTSHGLEEDDEIPF